MSELVETTLNDLQQSKVSMRFLTQTAWYKASRAYVINKVFEIKFALIGWINLSADWFTTYAKTNIYLYFSKVDLKYHLKCSQYSKAFLLDCQFTHW